ncbi:MAG: hypothetical protein ABIL39_01145 [candidate division WOR-3 bacterium]
MNGRHWGGLTSAILFTLSCTNHIIERSANDYFPLSVGNWWNYTNDDLYNPQSISITIETPDTILGTHCYPFNISGEFHYYTRDEEGIKEYIKFTQNYGGNEIIVMQGFITRLELPFVSGNRFSDSLVDSCDFYGTWIKICYRIEGLVAEYRADKVYGEVYKIIISKFHSITMPDSVSTGEEYLEEYYAPGIGMIEFKNPSGRFRLKDFHIE